MTKVPFSGGFENLSLLFAKNETAFQGLRDPGRDEGRSGRSERKDCGKRRAEALPHFLTRFLRLHGLLYGWSTQMHLEYAQSSQSWAPLSSQARTPPSARADQFALLLRGASKELERQLAEGNLCDSLLVRMLAICLFSVHFAVAKGSNLLASPPESGAVNPRTVPESLALQALYALVQRAASRVEAVEAVEKGEKGEKGRVTLNRMLPMLSVFCEWVEGNPHYMTALSLDASPPEECGKIGTPHSSSQVGGGHSAGSFSAASAAWDGVHYADAELLRVEVRCRSGMRASVAALQPALSWPQPSGKSQRSDDTGGTGAGPRQFLREHVELRGFLPVAAGIEVSTGLFVCVGIQV
ncbi:Est1 DNA/RNA binding domain-containing protein [Ochromonadaceae sp. CCMP2298]|nr:Est1 DNA/RNA binding domain-containing protein [Ochromonadaceae sp. CCMP2298]